jgi:hypothetical protein
VKGANARGLLWKCPSRSLLEEFDIAEEFGLGRGDLVEDI